MLPRIGLHEHGQSWPRAPKVQPAPPHDSAAMAARTAVMPA